MCTRGRGQQAAGRSRAAHRDHGRFHQPQPSSAAGSNRMRWDTALHCAPIREKLLNQYAAAMPSLVRTYDAAVVVAMAESNLRPLPCESVRRCAGWCWMTPEAPDSLGRRLVGEGCDAVFAVLLCAQCVTADHLATQSSAVLETAHTSSSIHTIDCVEGSETNADDLFRNRDCNARVHEIEPQVNDIVADPGVHRLLRRRIGAHLAQSAATCTSTRARADRR